MRACVDGAYLQGAVGELPATGVVRVIAEADDHARAKELVSNGIPSNQQHPPHRRDDDFDGVFEIAHTVQTGDCHLTEFDSDNDGYLDITPLRTWCTALGRVYFPATGRARKVDYSGNFKITHSDVDTNADGKMDQRITYDALGLVRDTADAPQP